MRKNLASYLDDYLERGRETVFVERRGLRYVRSSYAEVAENARRFARDLASRGIAKGDRVILRAANSAGWVSVFFGCLERGVIVVPLDVGSERGFVARVARRAEPKLAVVDGELACNAFRCPILAMEDLASSIAGHSAEPMGEIEVSLDDTFEIVFTSGTTSEPKGVRITHRNMLANLEPLEQEITRYLKYERFVHPIRFLNLLPLSHVFGQVMGLFAPQMLGGTVFFADSLVPARIVETIKRKRISVLVTVPRILEALREKIERDYESMGKLKKLKSSMEAAEKWGVVRRWWHFRSVHSQFGVRFWAFISGGAALSRETELFWDRLGFAVIQGYGMTETASLVSVNHPFKLVKGSIGKAILGQEVKIAPDGEILVRGENISPGSWDAEEAYFDKEGWYHTGDLGEIDAEGNIYFKGRKKDVIVTASGMNVYPEDIEHALERDTDVRAAVVIPAKGQQGQEPMAVIVPRDSDADLKAVIERVNRNLSEHQRIRRWLLWPGEDLPRTPTGKVRRRFVAERIREASSNEAVFQAEEASKQSALEVVLSKLCGEATTENATAKLGIDLKLDSLGRVELLGEIEERFQVELDEAAVTEEMTLAELEELVRTGKSERTIPYPYPRWQQRLPLSWLRAVFLEILVVPVTKILGRARIYGRERISKLRGPIVCVCNHVTVVDHALVLAALPFRIRQRMAIAMDGEVLRSKRHPEKSSSLPLRILEFLEYVLLVFFFNVFSMPRKSGFRRSFEFAGELVERGYSILVFPEGRYTEDGKIGHFMAGSGLLVSRLDVPVVPIRIDGLWGLKNMHRRRARKGEIHVRIGEPVSYRIVDSPDRVAADLEARVKNL